MYLTGMVDKRTLEKYEKEAKEKNRETWYLSWALDTNLEGQSPHRRAAAARVDGAYIVSVDLVDTDVRV